MWYVNGIRTHGKCVKYGRQWLWLSWLFPPPEGHGSNPVIGIFLHGPFFNLFKTVGKRKRGQDWPIPRTGRTITGSDLTNQVNLLALLPVQSNPLNKIVNQSDHFT